MHAKLEVVVVVVFFYLFSSGCCCGSYLAFGFWRCAGSFVRIEEDNQIDIKRRAGESKDKFDAGASYRPSNIYISQWCEFFFFMKSLKGSQSQLYI